MEIHIIDLKTNIKLILTNKEKFNNIDLNHKVSVKYLDKNNNINKIKGTVCSIEHEFSIDMVQKTYIKIY